MTLPGICKFFSRGHCKKGSNCRFQHVENTCILYKTNGQCTSGECCKSSHQCPDDLKCTDTTCKLVHPKSIISHSTKNGRIPYDMKEIDLLLSNCFAHYL